MRTSDGGFVVIYKDSSGDGLEKYGPDGVLQWKRNYGIIDISRFIQSSDGGFAIVFGDQERLSKNATIIKTGPDGLLQWERSFSTDFETIFNPIVAQSQNGNYLMIMETSNVGYVAVHYHYLVLLDASGNLQSERLIILSPELNNTNALSDNLNRIIGTSDGGFLVIGSRSEESSENIMTVKLSPSGNVISKQIFPGTEGSGEVVIPVNGGTLVSIPTGPGIKTINMIDENGVLQWSNRISDLTPLGLSKGDGWGPGPVRYCRWDSSNVVVGEDGYYLLAQERTGNQSPGIAKLNINGTLEWFKTIEPSYERIFISAENGTYKLAGWDSGMLHVDTFGDPIPGEISFESSLYNVSNAQSNITITLLRRGGDDGEVSVSYTTSNGSAFAGLDFLPVNDTVTFSDNETIRTINISLLKRTPSENNLSFSLLLSNVSGGASLGAPDETTVVISNTVTPTLSPSPNVTGIVLPFFGGNDSGVFHYPSLGKVVSTILALAIGFILVLIWPWLSKLLQLIFDAIKSYLQKQFSTHEAKYRRVVAHQRRPLLFGVSLMELFAGSVSIILIGIAFAIAKDYLFDPEKFIIIILAAGITIVVAEMARRYTASYYKAETEYKFWDIGALILIVTSLLHQPFSRPGRTIINNPGVLGTRKQGIIALAPCIISLLLSLIFLLIMAYRNGYELIGSEGFKIGMMICVYSLLPFEPMDGVKVLGWSKLVWGIVFIPALIFYLSVMLFVIP